MRTSDEDKTSLKARRIALGLSVQQLADLYGVSVNYIHRIEAHNHRTWAANIPNALAALLARFEAGYRPDDWPKTLKAGKRGRPRRQINAEAT